MYAQAVLKPNTLLRNGAYGIVMRGVHFCTRGCSSLRGRKRLPLCCIKLDTATEIKVQSLIQFSDSGGADIFLDHLPINVRDGSSCYKSKTSSVLKWAQSSK